jgi:hypothetical protein
MVFSWLYSVTYFWSSMAAANKGNTKLLTNFSQTMPSGHCGFLEKRAGRYRYFPGYFNLTTILCSHSFFHSEMGRKRARDDDSSDDDDGSMESWERGGARGWKPTKVQLPDPSEELKDLARSQQEAASSQEFSDEAADNDSDDDEDDRHKQHRVLGVEAQKKKQVAKRGAFMSTSTMHLPFVQLCGRQRGGRQGGGEGNCVMCARA